MQEGLVYSDNIIQTLKIMVFEILIPELTREIRNELTEFSENYVIKQCQSTYSDMLMLGPYQARDSLMPGTSQLPSLTHQASTTSRGSARAKAQPDEETFTLPDRPRCVVMGVIMHQIDSQTSIVSVAIVDKYGEVLNFDHFNKLLPPREFKPRQGMNEPTEEEEMRRKKQQMQNIEEKADHKLDIDRITALIQKYDVELIIVGANKLEARRLKETLTTIADNLRSGNKDISSQTQLKKTASKPEEEAKILDVQVAWGSLDVPKLFANSHASQKLLKGYDQIVKQAVSLARYQQDPMNEILNLWSFVIQENQALNLNLHPLQKMVNQAKLQESLEDINVANVNSVGIDINLIVNHEHMQILLSFLSAFGPRKAKNFIQKIKQYGGRISTRGEVYRNHLLPKSCYISSIAFMKVKIPPEDQGSQVIDILDMTRIHIESYRLSTKVACDALDGGS